MGAQRRDAHPILAPPPPLFSHRYLADVEGYDSDRKLHSLRYADGFVEHIALDQVCTFAHTCPPQVQLSCTPQRATPLT